MKASTTRRGRPPNDEKGWQISPLTWEQIQFIKRSLLKRGSRKKIWSVKKLAKKYRASNVTIMKARDGMLDHFFERKEDKRLAQKPETRFKKKVVKWIETELKGSYVITVDQSALRGIPDLICCIKGTMVGIELKRSYDETYNSSRFKLQGWCLNKIRKAGGYGYVIYPENWIRHQHKLRRIYEGERHDLIELLADQKRELQRGLEKARKS